LKFLAKKNRKEQHRASNSHSSYLGDARSRLKFSFQTRHQGLGDSHKR